MLLVVEIDGRLLVGGVLKVWSEQAQVLVLLLLVLHFGLVEESLLLVDLRLDDGLVLELKVVEDASGNLGAELLKSLSAHSELADTVDLESVKVLQFFTCPLCVDASL